MDLMCLRIRRVRTSEGNEKNTMELHSVAELQENLN